MATLPQDIPLLFLRERFPWMGAHSGYDVLFQQIEARGYRTASAFREKRRIPRLRRRFVQRRRDQVGGGSHFYDLSSFLAEEATVELARGYKYRLFHVAFAEEDYNLLRQQRPAPACIGTAHQPPGWWRLMGHDPAQLLKGLDAVITMSRELAAFLNASLPGKAHFLPHGVDTAFFSPPDKPHEREEVRCVFSGQWLRDLATLAEVIDRLLATDRRFRFEMIVPLAKRHDPHFHRIARHPEVRWHANLTDEQLRDLYRASDILLLPMIDATANNALLEGMACGLPVVANQVGGMPDYTRPEFATLLPIGDLSGFLEALTFLADDPDERLARGRAAAQFCREELAWETITAHTLELYAQTLSPRTA